MVRLTINGTPIETDADPEMPLLWLLRDRLDLTGTKYGCGSGLCGACTVLIDGRAVRSCTVPAGTVTGAVVTIEAVADARHGFTPDQARLADRVRRAWIAEQVPQCGYCQPGMVLAALALLAVDPAPTEPAIAAAMTNLCRCGTYDRVRRAIRRAADDRG